MFKQKEFSKILLGYTTAIFLLTVGVGLIFSWFGKDTSLFVYVIPSTAGVYAATISFYLNKAKIENILKIKIGYLNKLPEEDKVKVEEILTDKIDGELSEAISSKIEINTF